MEELRRLRVHSRVRGRLFSGGAHRARRHEPAELPQEQLRGRRGFSRARRRDARARNDQLAVHPTIGKTERQIMKNDRKETDKKKGTLRPWLVDVAVEHLR